MKVIVDWGLCDGNGVCAIEAPTVFEIDDDDELRLLKDQIDDAERARVDSAVRVCPKRALRLEP
ncbi:ferredoxin [Nocardia bovistercoris]|uniref:Ferredoxin n=1 Tax=Nocardia bovistercoris TaxID=2785916 RepID=A0A931IE55_9NOCA|nr:ferredoxin [Nocardia bovistercoris]MBH0779799.1 ferredoxin [Nocardia bovistercoris]